jgi:hypothetical protein
VVLDLGQDADGRWVNGADIVERLRAWGRKVLVVSASVDRPGVAGDDRCRAPGPDLARVSPALPGAGARSGATPRCTQTRSILAKLEVGLQREAVAC